MNNLVIGSRDADGYTYYETIGGGYGDPGERDPENRRSDRADGKVTGGDGE